MASDINTYDFIELKVYDIHGYIKGRLITRSRLPKVLESGMGMRAGICYDGMNREPNLNPLFDDEFQFANARLTPLLNTLTSCQKTALGDRKVAGVLCELRHPEDGSLDTSAPREATLVLLQRLQSEFGLRIKSSVEIEFGILDSKTHKPLGHDGKWASLTVFKNSQDVFIGLLEDMQKLGIKVDTLLAERGTGQFEVTFDITEGIEAADMVTEFRTASHVFLKMKGYDANFMACVDSSEKCHNSFHFNFSLWDSNGKNVFVDPTNRKQMSEFGRHWLAGMLEHAPAMTAICCPTVNCYRRLHSLWAPNFANWAYEKRQTCFRVKVDPGANVYLENRMPSSASSPHLILACTLAAGMDGVRRRLALPEPMEESRRLPRSLEEAIHALQADTLLRKALGPKLVDLFIYTKQTFEIDHIRSYGDLTDEEMLQKEKELYYEPF